MGKNREKHKLIWAILVNIYFFMDRLKEIYSTVAKRVLDFSDVSCLVSERMSERVVIWRIILACGIEKAFLTSLSVVNFCQYFAEFYQHVLCCFVGLILSRLILYSYLTMLSSLFSFKCSDFLLTDLSESIKDWTEPTIKTVVILSSNTGKPE